MKITLYAPKSEATIDMDKIMNFIHESKINLIVNLYSQEDNIRITVPEWFKLFLKRYHSYDIFENGSSILDIRNYEIFGIPFLFTGYEDCVIVHDINYSPGAGLVYRMKLVNEPVNMRHQ